MFTCPFCGGKAIDEPGNDVFVCASCGKLLDPDSVIDDKKEIKESEEAILKDQLAVADMQSKKERKITRTVWLIVLILCVLVTAVCTVFYFSIPDNEYVGYTSSNPRSEQQASSVPTAKTTITEKVLKEDYKRFYGNRGNEARNLIILIAAFADVMILFIGLLLYMILTIRARKRCMNKEESQGAMALLGLGLLFLLAAGALIGLFAKQKLASPKAADFQIYKIEFINKFTRSESDAHNYSSSSDVYYIAFSQNGERKEKSVLEDEYRMFPSESGTYYVGAVNNGHGTTYFRVYSEEEYQPGIYYVEYFN